MHDLVVVVVERHLDVEANKLGEMTVSVGVLGTEHASDGVHTVEVGRDAHLFVQLR